MDTSISVARARPTEAVLDILRRGDAELRGLFRLGSNDTFLCDVHGAAGSIRAVYKPIRGERPLWDFPAGTLAKREAAAFELSRALGWAFVPPTVFRADGPLGPGSFQEFLDLDLQQNYFYIREKDPDGLRRVAAFDIAINNADRKALHVALDATGSIRLIDHGICFHKEWKLRTVIWDFAGEMIPDPVRLDLENLLAPAAQPADTKRSGPPPPIRRVLNRLLTRGEIEATAARTRALLENGRFPFPGPGISVPWPILA
jgi:hypothetical protein